MAQPLEAEFSWKEFHLSLAAQNGRQLEFFPAEIETQLEWLVI